MVHVEVEVEVWKPATDFYSTVVNGCKKWATTDTIIVMMTSAMFVMKETGDKPFRGMGPRH